MNGDRRNADWRLLTVNQRHSAFSIRAFSIHLKRLLTSSQLTTFHHAAM